MDIITQAALGAALATAIAPSRQRRLAAGIGLVAGVLPDFDTLIQSGNDPLLVLDFHRHFTHALAFIPVGALLAALLLWPFLRRQLGLGRLYLYSFAGYALAGLLDACTSYGTQLWLPYSDERVAWNLIAVFDPLFTLLLLISLLITVRRPDSPAVHIGLFLAAMYLGFGYFQQQRVLEQMHEVAQARQHLPGRLIVKPTLGNLLLWRALYIYEGHIYADAVHAGPRLRHYPGHRAPLFAANYPEHAEDIARFRHFSDGWLVEMKRGEIGDARYAMLPTRIDPIWSIRWNQQQSPAKLELLTRHEMDTGQRQQWLSMLLGRDLPLP
jgi:inner membrane protein